MAITTQAGIIITQIGIDARTAADYQMIFNSNWPSLQIAYSRNINVPSGSRVTLTHNLKFFPFTIAWPVLNGVAQPRQNITLEVDKTKVYLTNPYYNQTVTVSVKVYNLDLLQQKDYALPTSPQVNRPYDSNYGIKVTKVGKSADSKDLRDFILHSRAQSPAVLSINTTPTAHPDDPIFPGVNIRYVNPAGYTPWVHAFMATSYGTPGTMMAFPPGGNQSFPAFIQYNKTSYILPADITANMSLIVLRDPLVVPTNIRVVY